MKLLPTIKLVLIVVVGIIILKVATKAAANKFPNAVTETVDNAVQTV